MESYSQLLEGSDYRYFIEENYEYMIDSGFETVEEAAKAKFLFREFLKELVCA
jgi:hypothetical protein